MKNIKILCLLLLSFFTVNAVGSVSCVSLLSTYQSKKIYTAQELHAIEQLAAAILAARIGPDGYKGLSRHNVDNLEGLNVEAILSNVTSQQRVEIREQIISDISNFFWNGGRMGGLPVGKYTKVNFSNRNGYFNSMQHLVIGRDRAIDQSLSVEIENFLRDSVDTVMVNASIMKHENRLISILKRDVLFAALITGVPTAAVLVVSGGIENIFYTGMGALYIGGMTISQGISAAKTNEVSPIWSPQVYDSSLGQVVRERYSFE